MKATEYIKELQSLVREYGDLEVCSETYDRSVDKFVIYPCAPDFWHRGVIYYGQNDKNEPVHLTENVFGNIQDIDE